MSSAGSRWLTEPEAEVELDTELALDRAVELALDADAMLALAAPGPMLALAPSITATAPPRSAGAVSLITAPPRCAGVVPLSEASAPSADAVPAAVRGCSRFDADMREECCEDWTGRVQCGSAGSPFGSFALANRAVDRLESHRARLT
jgi:hypothetical protein